MSDPIGIDDFRTWISDLPKILSYMEKFAEKHGLSKFANREKMIDLFSTSRPFYQPISKFYIIYRIQGDLLMPNETYEIKGQKFEWDRGKNLTNIEKHGITFKTAATTFFDPHAQLYEDENHSQDDERFVLIGMNENERLLTVCHCYRGKDESVTRIISARRATKYEENLYGGIV